MEIDVAPGSKYSTPKPTHLSSAPFQLTLSSNPIDYGSIDIHEYHMKFTTQQWIHAYPASALQQP